MKTLDFDFNLPPQLIAQTPLKDRQTSRLMVLNRTDQSIAHHHFFDIPTFFKAGDVLVINDTRVYPARLHGIKIDTHAHIEILILKIEEDEVECLVKKARSVKRKTRIKFHDDLIMECVDVLDQGKRRFRYEAKRPLIDILSDIGEMPLPPYIKEKLTDQDRYQTVYAKHIGSAAAPTAGLHFTSALLNQLEALGVDLVHITLHVGMGTFKPVETEDIQDHVMHAEVYQVNQTSADKLNRAKDEGRRIIAVGTTSVRTLETQMNRHGRFIEEQASTSIYITPGFEFKAIDALITNFHLPKSTLIMLVSAFADRSFILHAYQTAIDEGYRFFSFGDAMLIL